MFVATLFLHDEKSNKILKENKYTPVFFSFRLQWNNLGAWDCSEIVDLEISKTRVLKEVAKNIFFKWRIKLA